MVEFTAPPIQMKRWKKWLLSILGGATLAFVVDFGSRVAYGKYIAPNLSLSTAQKQEVKVIVDESSVLVTELRKQETSLAMQLTAKTVELAKLQQSSAQERAQKEQELRNVNKQILRGALMSGIDLYKIRQRVHKTVAQKLVNKSALEEIDSVIAIVQHKINLFQQEKMIESNDASINDLLAQYLQLRKESTGK